MNEMYRGEIGPQDRGLHYGHGVFTTLTVKQGVPQLWLIHLERLVHNAKRLGILFSREALVTEVNNFLHTHKNQNGVLKIIVTAGEGGRGYALEPASIRANRLLFWYGFPDSVKSFRAHGCELIECRLRLKPDEILAGVKHLNRLDQVLASQEVLACNAQDGLLLDVNHNIIETTTANLFMVSERGQLWTPKLNICGVSGVMRRFILEQVEQKLGVQVVEKNLTLSDLGGAREVFLSNSVRGIWPVVSILSANGGRQDCAVGPLTRQIQKFIADVIVE